MIGYRELENLRLSGYAPKQVWLHVFDEPPPAWLKQDAQDCIANEFCVSVLVLPNESAASLDLSALVGLTVQVMGENTPRSRAIIKECLGYAKTVLHCLEGRLISLRGIEHETLT